MLEGSGLRGKAGTSTPGKVPGPPVIPFMNVCRSASTQGFTAVVHIALTYRVFDV